MLYYRTPKDTQNSWIHDVKMIIPHLHVGAPPGVFGTMRNQDGGVRGHWALTVDAGVSSVFEVPKHAFISKLIKCHSIKLQRIYLQINLVVLTS